MIRLEDASFRYPIWQRRVNPSTVTSDIGGRIFKEKGRFYVEAMRNMNLTVPSGSRVGLIGMNGSGKSTLLKVCAGILPVTEGKVTIEGDISTLFATTIFSNPHLTGIENIRLLGAICGIHGSELDFVVEEVREFSELGAFIEMPVAAYSAGMRSRLGFGFATSLRRDILLVDEVIGAGDLAFYQKARAKVIDMLNDASTIIIASHSMNVIKTFCEEALWIRNGQVEGFGAVGDVTSDYVKYVKRWGAEKRAQMAGKISSGQVSTSVAGKTSGL